MAMKRLLSILIICRFHYLDMANVVAVSQKNVSQNTPEFSLFEHK
jgi:hypothetical protein